MECWQEMGLRLLDGLEPDAVVVRYMSCSYTAAQMRTEITKRSVQGRVWVDDILLIARNMLMRQARRPDAVKENKS